MHAAQHHQQQLEQRQFEEEHTWHCVYCGKEVPPDCEPETFACCGEIAHVERIAHD